MCSLFEKIRDFFWQLIGNQPKEGITVSNTIPYDPEEITDLEVSKVKPTLIISKAKRKDSKAKSKPDVSKSKFKTDAAKAKSKTVVSEVRFKAEIPDASSHRKFPVIQPEQRIVPTIRFKSQPHPFKKGHWIVVDSNGKTVYVSEDRGAAQVAAQELNKDRVAYDVKLKTIGQRLPFDLARYEENNGDWRTD